MALKKKPVTGMKDILPREMEIRNYVMDLIRETYGMSVLQILKLPAWSTLRTCPANRVEKMKN